MSLGNNDPYEWLENIDDDRVLNWVLEQDRRFRAYVSDVSTKLLPRLLKIYEHPYPTHLVCSRRGVYAIIREHGYYSLKLYSWHGDVETIVVSKDLGEDIVFKAVYTSVDGRFIAYSYSVAGADEGFVKVVDVDQAEEIDTLIGRIGSVVFLDSDRFYYVRFFAKERTPDGVEPPASRVYIRENGRDYLVFGEGIPTSYFISIAPTCCNRVMLTISYGWTKSCVYGGRLWDPESWSKIYGDGDYLVEPIGFTDGSFYVASYEGDGYGKVVSVDENDYSYRVIIESIPRQPLQSATVFRDLLVCSYLVDASSILRVYDTSGKLVKEISPEEKSTIALLSSTCDYVAFKLDTFRGAEIASLTPELEIRSLKSFLLDIDIEVEDLWIRSLDGTPIHAFVVKKRGATNLDRVLAFGYGGFRIALTPRLFPEAIPFIEDGGVFVVANIRGGSEFGEEWHREGMREKKQNVFNDFAAVLNYFRERSARIAAWGRSNGGLLVAAIVTRYPHLIDVAVIGYPVLDMLKFHKLYIGRAWVPEYGDPDNPRDREFLARYSPYHNIRPGIKYPKILVYTGLHDDRVHPGHAFKFVAKMLDIGADIFLRVERSSGHAGATPRVRAAEGADILAFIYKELGVDSPQSGI